MSVLLMLLLLLSPKILRHLDRMFVIERGQRARNPLSGVIDGVDVCHESRT